MTTLRNDPLWNKESLLVLEQKKQVTERLEGAFLGGAAKVKGDV